jgi:hypothetical protein
MRYDTHIKAKLQEYLTLHGGKLTPKRFEKYMKEAVLEDESESELWVEHERVRLYGTKSVFNQEVLEKEERRKRALDDFDYFLKEYFPFMVSASMGSVQKNMIRDAKDYKNKKGRIPVKKIRAIPRGFGKSTLYTLVLPIWLILRKEWYFIIIVSATLTLAKNFLREITSTCEDNERLIDDFPELLPAKDKKSHNVSWNDTDIIFGCGARVIAKGFLNSIRGQRYKQYRPDALLFDDPDEEKDVGSETRMASKMRWFDRASLRLGSQWGIDVVLSYTTIHPRCVGEQVFNDKRKYPEWDRLKISALEVNPETGTEESTWPAMVSTQTLLEERERDPISFARERQNIILPETDQKFKGHLKTYNYQYLTTSLYPDFPSNFRLTLGVDLSFGRSEQSDLSAIVGLARPHDSATKYVIFTSIKRRTPDVIEQDLLSALLLFNWNVCGIDASGNQEYFLYNMQKAVTEYNKTGARKISTPLIPLDNIGDKIARVTSALQPKVATGQILFRDDETVLFTQLDEYPHGYKDGPDALEYADRVMDNGVVKTVSREVIVAQTVKKPKTLEDIRRNQAKQWGFDI